MIKNTIKIYARVKPSKKISSVYTVDNDEQTGCNLEFVVPKDLASGFINNNKESYKFRFQKVFDYTVNQEEIFQTIAKPVADRVLAGYNGTIFAYGQTGSGKTFTITGGAEHYNDRGIIPRTLSYIYQQFSQNKNNNMVYTTHISYLEIYNEVGYDLLDPRHEASHLEDLPKVTIMEDPDQNIHLRNLSLQHSGNEEEALNLLFLGDTNRMIAETPMNQASTRSHCIFTVHICGREPGTALVRRSKLHLVDLAGSERVGKTGVGGQQLTEAKYINLSLHYLEQVIIALSEKNRSHIPYRNSMMTSVLRDSLGGNCMTTMIATVSVEKKNVEESISTCRFAQRVALIKNEAVLNEELDPALLIGRLKREIQSLKEEIILLTGEQREDQLTPDEIQTLEELVKAFLDDPDPEVSLGLGPDMRKINFCFSLLKVMVQERLSGQSGSGDHSSSGCIGMSEPQDSHHLMELTKLKEALTHRDNEISILVNMLKREKKRNQDAAAQLATMSNSCNLPSQRVLELSISSQASSEDILTEHEALTTLHKRRGPVLSIGAQEAFEIFKRDNEDRITIEKNKALLKQRFTEAKVNGEQLNGSRTKVSDLKKQLERHRMQRAAHGLTASQTLITSEVEEVEEVDQMEESLCKQIEKEKKIYKDTFGRLKALKTEIEHLQLLLERGKVKLQRDFQEWWSQETYKLETSELQSSGSNISPNGQTSIWTSQTLEPISPDTTLTRVLSTSELPLSSLPLTGDQQTDADIQAFIRARQHLLNRTGTVQ
ncbi:kinesin-like protein KIF6 isoform X2 [Osmerus eperlanus]|uniref:kinesin-like protein KIF6 isoform X2 n=1 Tax=Osmerus eperlanus TaxID=29151 RepID=UPI002E0E8C84